MELEKFIAAKDNRYEFDKLVSTIQYLDSSFYLNCQNPLVIYDGYPIEGNTFIVIPSSISCKVKECIRKIIQERVNELEKEFEKL